MKFAETHEWVELQNDHMAKVGISNHAQGELGEIVYVELPKIGTEVKRGGEIVVLESTKAAADVYAPVSGKVLSVNEALSNSPELVNDSPEKEGWLYTVALSDLKELDLLMSQEQYQTFLKK